MQTRTATRRSASPVNQLGKLPVVFRPLELPGHTHRAGLTIEACGWHDLHIISCASMTVPEFVADDRSCYGNDWRRRESPTGCSPIIRVAKCHGKNTAAECNQQRNKEGWMFRMPPLRRINAGTNINDFNDLPLAKTYLFKRCTARKRAGVTA